MQSMNRLLKVSNYHVQSMNRLLKDSNYHVQSMNRLLKVSNHHVQPMNRLLKVSNHHAQSMNRLLKVSNHHVLSTNSFWKFLPTNVGLGVTNYLLSYLQLSLSLTRPSPHTVSILTAQHSHSLVCSSLPSLVFVFTLSHSLSCMTLM